MWRWLIAAACLLLSVPALAVDPTPRPRACNTELFAATDPDEAGTVFLDPADHAGSGTETDEDNYRLGISRIAHTLRCTTATAPGTGNSWTNTLRAGAVGAIANTIVACTITGTATTCNSAGTRDLVGPDEVVTISVLQVSTPDASALMTCTVCLE